MVNFFSFNIVFLLSVSSFVYSMDTQEELKNAEKARADWAQRTQEKLHLSMALDKMIANSENCQKEYKQVYKVSIEKGRIMDIQSPKL